MQKISEEWSAIKVWWVCAVEKSEQLKTRNCMRAGCTYRKYWERQLTNIHILKNFSISNAKIFADIRLSKDQSMKEENLFRSWVLNIFFNWGITILTEIFFFQSKYIFGNKVLFFSHVTIRWIWLKNTILPNFTFV